MIWVFILFYVEQTNFYFFSFRDRRALVSTDSNSARHMTGFYHLMHTQPCNILVNSAFDGGQMGVGSTSGTMQLCNMFFEDTVFVPGIREIIIFLGQLDQEGCRTEMSKGKMKVFRAIW